jgi:ATP-dependent RNA helicase RhlE
MSFDSLGLRAELLSAVAEQGYAQPTPIQSQAIPLVLGGRDVLGAAQTGTGKTAGFALPMLQRLAEGTGTKMARALIITPTRELAAQVHADVRTYGKHLALRSAVIFGGVGMQPQIDALRRGVDIVVATPGRLLDHARQKTVDLRHIEILVLDEADRMLDMGFIPDIRRILALLPAKRQNVLFSATFPDEIRKLAATILRNPATVEVARRNTAAELVAQSVYRVAKDRKRDLLAHLVQAGDWRQVLVFCKTKRGANRLAQHLERGGIEADAIHGNKSQNARTRALQSFKDGELRVLVATDIAARGLDIEQLPHVVNFDMPHVPEDYVHRIGRTGRAGASGEAVSLVCQEEQPLLTAIEKLMGRRVESREAAGFSNAGSASAQAMRNDNAQAQRRSGAHGKPQRHSPPAPHRQSQAPRHQPKGSHSQSQAPHRHSQAPRHQDRHGQPAHQPAQAVTPGYRPLTAHAPMRRVPALLARNRSKNS